MPDEQTDLSWSSDEKKVNFVEDFKKIENKGEKKGEKEEEEGKGCERCVAFARF